MAIRYWNQWRGRYASSLAALAGLAALPAAAFAGTEDVVLRLKDSLIEVAGALKSFDGETYVVDARAFGVLSLPAERYVCEGESCAASHLLVAARSAPAATATFDFGTGDGTTGAPHFSIEGSDTLGRELMPSLIRSYAESSGGSVSQLVGASPRSTRFKVRDRQGGLSAVIDIERTSPSEGIASLTRGTAAIAMSTRPILEAEAAALSGAAPQSRPQDLEHVLALDALSIVVAPESPVRALSVDKLAQVFAGRITDWSEVGRAPGRINLYVGPDHAGSSDAFNDLVLKPGNLGIAPAASRLAGEAEVSDAVARDRNGIGVTSYGMLRNARALPIATSCGLTWTPDEFSIKAEEYPLGRRLYLYAAGRQDASESLLRFASSTAAQAAIRESPFLDQSVVRAAYSEQGQRVSRWRETAAAGTLEKRMASALIEEIEDAERLSLTFRFALGSSQLDAKARQDLSRLAELLRTPEYAGKTVLLLGFTDWVGKPDANAALAERRASEVRAAVLSALPLGAVDGERLVARGFGAIAPVACNDGPEGMNRNRRVEVWIRDRVPSRPAVVQAVQAKPAASVRYRKRKR